MSVKELIVDLSVSIALVAAVCAIFLMFYGAHKGAGPSQVTHYNHGPQILNQRVDDETSNG